MTTPAQNDAARAQLRANAKLLARRCKVPALNAGKCLQAIADALVNSVTPPRLVGDGSPSLAIKLGRALVDTIENAADLENYNDVVGALPDVVLPGPPGPPTPGGNVDGILNVSWFGDGLADRPLFSGTPGHKVACFAVIQNTGGGSPVFVGMWIGANIVAPIKERILVDGTIEGHGQAFNFVGVQGQVIANPGGLDDTMNQLGYPYTGIAFLEPQ